MTKWNVNIDYIKEVSESTGHAIIQVNKDGENSIIIHGGANRAFESNQIDMILKNFNQGDILLLQNEINKIPEIKYNVAAKFVDIILLFSFFCFIHFQHSFC